VTVTVVAGALTDALKEKLVDVTAVAAVRCADRADLDEAPALPANPKVAPTPITPTVETTVSHFVPLRDISDLLQISAVLPAWMQCRTKRPRFHSSCRNEPRPPIGAVSVSNS
jgi:hypothetical protein